MKKGIMIIFSLLVVSLAVGQSVAAAELSDRHKQRIAEACPAAQSTLQRISSSDTTARINRGRDYDQVLKLFYAMNTRVASNNIAEPMLAQLTKSFEDRLNDFRNDYNKFNDQLKSTYELDCKNHVNTFYDSLVKTRSGRATVNSHISQLDNIINDYQQAVAELVR